MNGMRRGSLFTRNLVATLFIFYFVVLATVSEADASEFNGSEGATPKSYFGYVATYETATSGAGQIHVIEVYAGGPASKAGLVAGDRIRRVDGRTFQFANDLEMIRRFGNETHPGDRLALLVERQGDLLELVLTVGVLPETRERELNQWMAKANDWFEEGGFENCRANQEKGRIHAALVSLAGEEGMVVTMERSRGGENEVRYAMENGDFLPLSRLQNTFLDALAKELPAGHSWRLLIQRQDDRRDESGLVIVPQTGPRIGQRGFIVYEDGRTD